MRIKRCNEGWNRGRTRITVFYRGPRVDQTTVIYNKHICILYSQIVLCLNFFFSFIFVYLAIVCSTEYLQISTYVFYYLYLKNNFPSKVSILYPVYSTCGMSNSVLWQDAVTFYIFKYWNLTQNRWNMVLSQLRHGKCVSKMILIGCSLRGMSNSFKLHFWEEKFFLFKFIVLSLTFFKFYFERNKINRGQKKTGRKEKKKFFQWSFWQKENKGPV